MINWTNWDMWAAIGQLLGTFITLLTAIVALIQVRDSRRHNEEVRRQAERQIEEAKEAMKPELELQIDFQGFKAVRIMLINKKPVPVYVMDFHISAHIIDKNDNYVLTGISKEEVSVEVPKYLNFGEVCIATIPIKKLKNKVEHATHHFKCIEGVFHPSFRLATGEKYTCSIYIDLNPEPEDEIYAIYIHEEEKQMYPKESLKKGRSIHGKLWPVAEPEDVAEILESFKTDQKRK